jgi:hypothetical protein
MYIIDQTYFTRDLSIPNINEVQTEAFETLEYFVDEYVRQLLRDALGIEIFNILDTYVIDGAFDSTGAPQYIIDLVEGKEYVKSGVTYKWSGLISTQGVFKKSLLANYVYYQWLKNSFSTQSGVGEVTLNPQNANLVNPTQKLVTAWNSFVTMYQNANCVYPNVYYKGHTQVIDWLGYNVNTEVSLIEYLNDNDSDFITATLRVYEYQNQLGI